MIQVQNAANESVRAVEDLRRSLASTEKNSGKDANVSDDSVDITSRARYMELAYSSARQAEVFDETLISSVREKLTNVPVVSDVMAEVIAEKIVKGYSGSILAS